MALILILYELLDEHIAEFFKRYLAMLLFPSANGRMSDWEDTSRVVAPGSVFIYFLKIRRVIY